MRGSYERRVPRLPRDPLPNRGFEPTSREEMIMTVNDRLRISHLSAELALKHSKALEYRKVATVRAIQIESDLEIETREGWLTANKGDYLVVNAKDGTYPWPVKKEIFESTYEECKE